MYPVILQKRLVDHDPAAVGGQQAGADRGPLEEHLEALAGMGRGGRPGGREGDVEDDRDTARDDGGTGGLLQAERADVDREAVGAICREDLA